MSTHCAILAKKPDSEAYRVIYVHFDGYPAPHGNGVGYILENYYNEPAKIQALMDKGDLNNLQPEIKDCEVFDFSQYTREGSEQEMIQCAKNFR